MVELLAGTVIATHGSLVRVQAGEQTLVVACRRRLRWEGVPPPDPRLVVGDQVDIESWPDGGVVVAARPRRTCLLRRAPGSERPQVLAANIDQALVVLAARVPPPSSDLLDRFLVACHLAGIDPIVAINKVDQGIEEVESWLPTYRRLGYRVLLLSARTGRGLGQVKRSLGGRTTLFCGPSGAGKSSLLNAIYPGFRLRVGSISDATGRGRHTTSRAELMPLPYGGFVVDTPGLKEFGLWNPSCGELERAFPEVAARAGGCRFQDCSHVHEPDCAVLRAVESGEVEATRYRTWVAILSEAQGSS